MVVLCTPLPLPTALMIYLFILIFSRPIAMIASLLSIPSLILFSSILSLNWLSVCLILLMMLTPFISCYIIMISPLSSTSILETREIAHLKALSLLPKRAFPFAPQGHMMAYNGFCKDRQRHKWRCPITRKKWQITCDSPCSTSSYGRVFYTREQDNLRFFTRIPRGSTLFKARYRRRTSSERGFKRLKEDYLLERKTKTRTSNNWYFRAFSTAMCLHIDAWVKYLKIDLRDLILAWQSEVAPTVA